MHQRPRGQFELRAYERLAEVFVTLLGEGSLETRLEAIADAVDALIPSSALLLFRIDTERQEMLPLVARGPLGAYMPLEAQSVDAGLVAKVVATRRPVYDKAPGRASAGGAADAIIVVPLVARGAVNGCLAVYRRGPAASFTEAEFRFVTRFSAAAALALDNEEARARLSELAHTDELTGVLNRRGFYEALEKELARSERRGSETSVLVVDVDELKAINDSHGHEIGDAVLTRIGRTIEQRMRAGDFVGRIGGDEFAVGLAETAADAAQEIAAELEEMIAAATVSTLGAVVVPRATVGFATVENQTETVREVVRRADFEMYRRKGTRKSMQRGAA